MVELVVLVDVDHTLLDGDAVRARIAECVAEVAGAAAVPRFWLHYEAVRAELGRVDVPEAAARVERDLSLPEGSVIAAVESADFATCLYEGAREALAHLGTLGETVVLTDGDERFQRAKVERAGIARAVAGRVYIATHKEHELDEVTRRFPAAHYALLDDRAGILATAKALLGGRITTLLVRQGRYASEAAAAPAPDLEVASIREVRGLDRAALIEPRA